LAKRLQQRCCFSQEHTLKVKLKVVEKSGSGPRNRLDRHIANLPPEEFERYQQHQGSIDRHKNQRSLARDIAALANTVGPHSDAPDRAHIHGNVDNHNPEDNHRDIIEHLAQGMMRQQGIAHHQPNMEQLVGQKDYESFCEWC
jgi:hypothetical protein